MTTSKKQLEHLKKLNSKQKGVNHPSWKGGIAITGEGYRLIHIDGRYIREHRFVAQKMIGRPLRDDEIVHHLNGDRLDNCPENLQIMSQAEHFKIHMAEAERPILKRDSNGRWLKLR